MPPGPELTAAMVADLADRWRRARCGVLGLKEGAIAAELRALGVLAPDEYPATLRRVFDHSLRLGRGFLNYHGLVWERGDIEVYLGLLGVPCLTRQVQAQDSFSSFSGICGVASTPPAPIVCDFYREACDGLILGLSNGEVFWRRHRAQSKGDAVCLDVAFDADKGDDNLRLGEIPPDVYLQLQGVEARLRRLPGIQVKFKGLSEGVLAYEVIGAPAELAVERAVGAAVARCLPQVQLQNLAPRAIID